MEQSSRASLKVWLLYGGCGLVAGICLAITATGLLVVQRAKNPLTPLPALAVLSSTPPSADTPPPLTQTPSPRTPPRAAQALLDQAERDLAEGQAQQVLDALLPHLDQFHTDADQALAYDYLGQAEFQLGHFQFAAAYFEKAYALQPTAQYLYELAAAYDWGGDLEHALDKYQTLVQSTDPEAEAYRFEAEQRIAHLIEVLGTLTPTHKPLPTATLAPTPEGAIVVDLATGTGALALLAGDYPVFCFHPARSIEYKSVMALTFWLIGTNQSGPADLQLYPWDFREGAWGTVNLDWGDNSVEAAHRYVSPAGGICAGLRNVSGQTINVENAGFTFTVQNEDGSTAVYGLK